LTTSWVAAPVNARAEGLDETDGVLQVRAHPHFGDGHRDVGQGRIGQLLLAQDFHQRMTDQLAGAQLALGRAGGGLVTGFPVAGGGA